MRPLLYLYLFLSLTLVATSRPVLIDGIAAKAHGEIITVSELNLRLGPVQSRLMKFFPRQGAEYRKKLNEYRVEILDDLIDRAIIYGQFKDRIHAIPNSLVEAESEKFIQRNYGGNKTLFNKYLKATGLTYKKYEFQRRKDVLYNMIQSQHHGNLPPVTKAELNKEYAKWSVPNRNRDKDIGTFRKIYIPAQDLENPDATPEEQLTLAEDIAAKIKAGKSSFEEMAKKYSKDAEAENGGLWENVPRKDLPEGFASAIFETVGHDLLGPVGDPRIGYTIFKVIKRKYGPANKSLSAVRTDLERTINNRKNEAVFEKWMKKIRDRKMIQKNP